MKIVGVWLSNFASYWGDHYFPLMDRGTVLLLGRNHDDPRATSNGSGKSQIGDAIDWALFGESPRGDVVDAVVNDEAGKDCSVTVAIVDDDGVLIKITRSRGFKAIKDGPRYWVNGEEKTALDSAVTQKQIEALIGLDRQVFHAAVLFAQGGGFSFADASDGERKEVLTKVVQCTEVDEWAELLNERLVAVEAKLTPISLELTSTVERLAQERQRDFSGSISGWEQERAQRMEAVAGVGRAAEEEVARLGALLQQSAPDPAPGLVPPPPQLVEIDTAIATLVQRINVATADIGAERGRFTDAQRTMQQLVQRGTGVCAACNQPITPGHLESEKARVQEQLTSLTARGKALAATLADLNAQRQAREQERRHFDGLHRQAQQQQAAQRAVAQQQANERTATTVAYQRAQHASQQAQRTYLQMQQEVNPFLAQQQASQQLAVQLEAQVAALHVASADLEKTVVHLRFWKTGFGNKGLKSFILDACLDEMTTEVNRWVNLLTGGTVWVRFETQKQVGSGKKTKLSETFTLRVFRYNPDGSITERNFRSWSGGEKHRIALGVDFGLARLVASRAKRNYDLLILDEVMGQSLDNAGKEAVAELLGHLAKEKSTILVIDHDIIFQGLFEETIFVEKRNRRSTIMEPVKCRPDENAVPKLPSRSERPKRQRGARSIA